MQKILIGIFAHPDDEAFGPCGTLLLETRAGTELHLISLTAGESGMNPDGHDNLAEVRLQEWRQAGELLGAKKMYHLGYADGTLGNNDHQEITQQIMDITRTAIAGRDNVVVEFMSMDLNGITGHIDHIVAGRSSCLAYCRLADEGLPMSRIRLACIPKQQFAHKNTSFVYMEAGRDDDVINETVDARHIAEDVRAVMHCHHTQRDDAEVHMSTLGDDIAVDYFIVQES